MAKYDYGGGCPCGLQYECDPGCIHYAKPKIVYVEIEKKKKVKKMNKEDDDFGFTFSDSIDNLAANEDLNNRLEDLRNFTIKFLEKMKSNPEKDTIYWPNRVKKIEEMINKVNEIAGK